MQYTLKHPFTGTLYRVKPYANCFGVSVKAKDAKRFSDPKKYPATIEAGLRCAIKMMFLEDNHNIKTDDCEKVYEAAERIEQVYKDFAQKVIDTAVVE